MKEAMYVVMLLFISCTKGTDIVSNVCIPHAENPAWNTILFKNDHTIQFPNNYEGRGMVGFEGNTFIKQRSDNKIIFKYAYCGPLYCEEFGRELSLKLPDTIVVNDKNMKESIMFLAFSICQGVNVEGAFYHDKKAEATGTYFIKKGGGMYEAVTVEFPLSEIKEVENILKTISLNECQQDLVCTAIFVSLTVKFTDNTGNIVKPANVWVEFTKTNTKVTIYPEFQGQYNIVTDGDIGKLKKAGSDILLKASDANGKLIAEESYKVGHDCCHIKKVSGKDIIIVN